MTEASIIPAIESVSVRRLFALLLPVLLLITACSGGSTATTTPSATTPAANAEALASVKVTAGAKGKAPKVTFDKPLAIKAESIRVVTQGTGAVVKADQIVVLRGISFDAETAKTLGENFTAAAGQSYNFNDELKKGAPLVYNTIVGAKVGSFVAYGVPAMPAVAATSTTAAQAAQPEALIVYQIESATPPAQLMSAEDTAKLAKAGGLPTAKFNAKGVPSITIPKKTAPADLVVQVLTPGTGAVIAKTDSISAYYTGWTWSDSKQFDSNYGTAKPATFSLSGVIPGWTQGLAGQKVGAVVQLTIPASLAYGDTPAAGQPAGTLVFVVKIESKS